MSKKIKANNKSTQILTIPKGSLVLTCAAPNSGKTTLSKKLFSGMDDVVLICSDDIFRENVAKASMFETYESLMEKTTKTVTEMVEDGASKGKTVVIDATSHFVDERLAMIDEFRPLFKNIVLIVIDLDIPDLISHGVKPQSPIMKRFDMYAPELDNTLLIALLIKTQFKNRDIYKGVNTVYRITSQTLYNCKGEFK